MHKSATSQRQSPSGDRNVSPIPHPLPPSSLPQAKNTGMAATGKDHALSNPPPTTFTNVGTKKVSAKTATSTATLTSGGIYDQQQQQQLATITLTSMGAMSGTSTNAAKKDRVSSPFGAQRVASPSPILTITPSEGPSSVAPRQKEPTTGGRKPKGKKGAGGQQTQRPTPYARPTPPPPPPTSSSSSSTVSSIPQLGVPGLSIEPVVGPLLSPMMGKVLPTPTASQTNKSGPQTVGASGMNTTMKDLVASYTELLQKYPHMARSVLMNQKSLNTTTGGPIGAQATGGRKQSAKQAAKAAAAMSMQSAGAAGSGPPTGGSGGGNRFGGSNMPRIGATITPLPAAGFSIDSYGRPATAASGSGSGGNLATSAAALTMQPMSVGSNQQQGKTLQQKLAERQKANKARETEGVAGSVGTGQPKSGGDPDDVIVLE